MDRKINICRKNGKYGIRIKIAKIYMTTHGREQADRQHDIVGILHAMQLLN